jgi:hypothetical protein
MNMRTLKDFAWYGVLTVIVVLTYAWVQSADDAAMKVELARAEQQGYHAGYSKGSSAGLVAMYKACTATVGKPCDSALAQAVVDRADEVQ